MVTPPEAPEAPDPVLTCRSGRLARRADVRRDIRASGLGPQGGAASGPAEPVPRRPLGIACAADDLGAAWAVLGEVLDPEVPALSLVDLGIVRDLQPDPGTGGVRVVLTPTYSGCPATEVIEQSVVAALDAAGFGPVAVTLQRSPAWTTDWISAEGRRKLRDYGIAPPGPVPTEEGGPPGAVPIRIVRRSAAVPCPRCDSADTERLSAFGATACKALYRCRACREPFEHFKPI